MSSGHSENRNGSRRKPSNPALIKALKVAVPVSVFALIAVLLLLTRTRQAEPGQNPDISPHAEVTLKRNGETCRIPNSVETVLVMGLDMFDEEVEEDLGDYYNFQQADFIMYLVFDNENRKVNFIQLNRDTMCDVPWLTVNGLVGGTSVEQLCLAHTYGSGGRDSCENTAAAVKELMFGAPVDHYISFTMDSVGKINDLVGGVSVKIEDDFSAIDPFLVKGETIKLTGDQALTFVRARRGVGTGDNRERMNRQRQYMHSFVESAQTAAEKNENLSSDAYALLKDSIVTDMTSAEVTRFADRLNSYELGEIRYADGTISVGEDTGWVEFYADEDSLWKIITESLSQKKV